MSYLDSIIARKKLEVEAVKKAVPLDSLKESLLYDRRPISLSQKISSKRSPSVIAEFKRASPSRGVFSHDVSVKDVVSGYEEAGVAGISVLTDEEGFSGTLFDLKEARSAVSVPILRKDFTVDVYQVYEAKAYGADLILLIAAALTRSECAELASVAQSIGLEVLLELHSQDEIPYINNDISIIGVNNRDLKSFETSLETSIEMFSHLPKDRPIISESGISNSEDISRLYDLGYHGFLIGGSFMEKENPAFECAEFIAEIEDL